MIQKEETDLPSPVSNPNSEGRPPFSPPNRPTPRNSREDKKKANSEMVLVLSSAMKRSYCFS
jgi:hypothetical protein